MRKGGLPDNIKQQVQQKMSGGNNQASQGLAGMSTGGLFGSGNV